jgi:hypothetical protein
VQEGEDTGVKTNRQIAAECAEAAWSWLCERYGLPIPAVRQLLHEIPQLNSTPSMPSYRISMTRKKPFYVPGVPSSKPGEVVIAGTSLLWLPNCRTNNTIESWTLQFVGEFTRSIELQKNWNQEKIPEDITPRAILNQIEFAKLFFPHLARKHKEAIKEIMKSIRADLKRIEKARALQQVNTE